MPVPLLRMIREDESSAFSCHSCLQAIPRHSPLFFMNDRVFCSSRCRLASAAPVAMMSTDHSNTEGGLTVRMHKRSMSKVNVSLDSVGEHPEEPDRKERTASPVDGSQGGVVERATKGGSVFAYVGQLSSWLSADSFV